MDANVDTTPERRDSATLYSATPSPEFPVRPCGSSGEVCASFVRLTSRHSFYFGCIVCRAAEEKHCLIMGCCSQNQVIRSIINVRTRKPNTLTPGTLCMDSLLMYCAQSGLRNGRMRQKEILLRVSSGITMRSVSSSLLPTRPLGG